MIAIAAAPPLLTLALKPPLLLVWNASASAPVGLYRVHPNQIPRRGDLVIGITFRRGLRQTVEGLRQASARGAYCVALTDTHLSPLARFAQECFVTPVEGTLYGVSYVAPMAFLNMVLVACAGTRKARTIRLMKAAGAEQRTGFRWYRDGVG